MSKTAVFIIALLWLPLIAYHSAKSDLLFVHSLVRGIAFGMIFLMVPRLIVEVVSGEGISVLPLILTVYYFAVGGIIHNKVVASGERFSD